MIELTAPQVWTLIGVFTAAMFGLLTVVSTLFVRFIDAKFERVDAQFERVEARFDARFERVDSQCEHLHRDIQALVRRVFPDQG